ncbi:MAG: hypothetical protein ACFWUC_00770 [Oscillospiraceae bacterium]
MRGIPLEKIIPAAKAVYDGGVRVIECTFEQDTVDPCAVLRRKLSNLTNTFGDKMLIGAGTVLTPEQVQTAYDAGARMIVTPNTNREVIELSKKLGMTTVIGAMTPTEIAQAYAFGADYIKIFPASHLGASYIKSVTAPLSHIPLLAVGGIHPQNIPEFIQAGVKGFGIGTPLFPKQAIDRENYEQITTLAHEFCCALHKS